MTDSDMKRYILNRIEIGMGISIAQLTLGIMSQTQPTQFDEGQFHSIVEHLVEDKVVVVMKTIYMRNEVSFLFRVGTKFSIGDINIAT